MVSRGSVRALGVSLAALLFVLLGASAVTATPSCSVSVSPKTGTAGSVFTFHGNGFKPTDLTLHKNDAEAGNHSLTEASTTWSVAVRSRPGDEGDWSAEFSSNQCSAVATFTVTLSNTDVAMPGTTPTGGSIALSLAAHVLAAGAAGGVFLGRKLNASSADNQAL
jgi:hypothetical protein